MQRQSLNPWCATIHENQVNIWDVHRKLVRQSPKWKGHIQICSHGLFVYSMKKFLLMKQAPSVTQIASPFSKPLLYVLYCIGREYAHLQNEVFGLLQYSCYLFKNFTNKPHESQFTTSKSQSTCCDQEARLSLSLSRHAGPPYPVHTICSCSWKIWWSAHLPVQSSTHKYVTITLSQDTSVVDGSNERRQAQYRARIASTFSRWVHTLLARSAGDDTGWCSNSVSEGVGWKPAPNKSTSKLSACTQLASFLISSMQAATTRGLWASASWSPLNKPLRYLQGLSFIGAALMASTQ